MSVPGSKTGDEGRTCGLRHHENYRISSTGSVGRSIQWVSLFGQGDTKVGCGMGEDSGDIGG